MGLAKAYHDLRKSCTRAIWGYLLIFYASIATILYLTMGIFETHALPDPANDIRSFITEFLRRTFFVLPLVWLAIFASKRRSESDRLRQEYAHKEALAKSYQSFKYQIEQLDIETKEPLMEKLLSASIDTISENASKTLDKHHGDKPPMQEITESILNKISTSKN